MPRDAMKNQTLAEGRGLAEVEIKGLIAEPQNIAPSPAAQAQAKRRSPYHEAAVQTLLILRAKYPQCFARLDLPRRQPLKVGIHHDILNAVPELPVADIRLALKFYTGDINYLKQCVEGRKRIDLNGNDAGIVTAEEAEHCAKSLDGIVSKWRKKKTAPVSPPAQPPSNLKPRLTLAALKEAAAKRKLEMSGA